MEQGIAVICQWRAGVKPELLGPVLEERKSQITQLTKNPANIGLCNSM